MSITNMKREYEVHKPPTSKLQRRPDVPFNSHQTQETPLRMGFGILAAAALVGISILAIELLVIMRPDVGFAGTFIVLVAGAVLAGYVLACTLARIFKREK